MILKSSRLTLSKIKESSIHKFDEVNFSYNVMKYITGHALTKEEAIERYLRFTHEPYYGNYFVQDTETREIVGLAKLTQEGEGIVEIGYSLFEKHWGKGYATEIAQTLIDFAITALKPNKIMGIVDSRNPASIHVLEKVGLQKEGEATEETGVRVYMFARYVVY
ncbi:GNAT family N-acetyltransferase [Emticicia sp. 17c]|uniref:GNAT family N-acetyltransferase n=1 Tax=Emticicia sp. 17c TaxID=3127704 RepID=UPI00301DCBBC